MPLIDLYRLYSLAASPHRFVLISIAIIVPLNSTLQVRLHTVNYTLPQRDIYLAEKLITLCGQYKAEITSTPSNFPY